MTNESNEKVHAKRSKFDWNDDVKSLKDLKKEFTDPEWQAIAESILARKKVFLSATRVLDEFNFQNPHKLAAADVFVEKAQSKLTDRANRFFRWGHNATIWAVFILCLAAASIYWRDIDSYFDKKDITTLNLIFVLFKMTSFGLLVGGVIYFLANLARALYHEATALEHRRHALRFGRLYTYLKEGEVDFKELEEACKWNSDFPTAFQKMPTDKMTLSILHKILSEVRGTAEAVKPLWDKVNDKAKGKIE